MAPGRRFAGRRGRSGLLVLLAGVLLLVLVDGPTGTSAMGSRLRPPSAETQLDSTGPTPVQAPAPTPTPVPTPAPAPTPPPVPVDAPLVLDQVQAAAAAARGSIAVVVVDAQDRILLASPDAQSPLYSASLIKLPVVAELLARQAAGLVLSPEDLARMERASTASDDNAMSLLWGRHDGPALIAAATARLGLTGTFPPAIPGQWGEAIVTAADVAGLLSRVDEAFGVAAAATLIGWLRMATPRAADGFDQFFGLLFAGAAAAGPTAAKQGWMCCVGGRRQLHSAGVLADGRVVALLGDFPVGAPWSAARAALDTAAAAVVAGTAAPPGPQPNA